jgi:hypothetical protein
VAVVTRAAALGLETSDPLSFADMLSWWLGFAADYRQGVQQTKRVDS